jgi:hypothetical protein
MGQRSPIKADTAGNETVGDGGHKCPICRAPAETEFRPFCSRRCADVDLSRWLRGAYVISDAGQDGDEDDDEVLRAQSAERDDER